MTKFISKPEAVWEYNASMGGVDRSDQSMSFYNITRKRCRKYYHKIFKHMLEQVVHNVLVLYRYEVAPKKVDHASFMLQLIARIMEEHSGHIDLPPRVGATLAAFGDRLTGRHFPVHREPNQPGGRVPRSICFVCQRERGRAGITKRKHTPGYCPVCKVHLCPIGCFEKFHTSEDI